MIQGLLISFCAMLEVPEKHMGINSTGFCIMFHAYVRIDSILVGPELRATLCYGLDESRSMI